MKKLFGLLAAFICAAAPAAAQKIAPPDREQFHLLLLIGQSNMAGRGFVTDENRRTDPRILMLDRSGGWVVAADPVHYDKKSAGVGLARTFAAEWLKQYPDATVGLIPAACGGSSLEHWVPGQYFKPTGSHPYDDAVNRARLAMRDGTLKAVLFHQGESDCSRERSMLYYDRLTALVKRLRGDLNAAEVPLVIGQLSQWKKWSPYRTAVDAAQRRVVREQPPAAFATSEDLTSNPDLIHFNADSIKIFGKRYFDACLPLLKLHQ